MKIAICTILLMLILSMPVLAGISSHFTEGDLNCSISVEVMPVEEEVTFSSELQGCFSESLGGLGNIDAIFYDYPIVLRSEINQKPANPHELPAVPGAIAMGLVGFLCVSLIRDRRIWLGAIAGILSLSQAGLLVMPQLTLRLFRRGFNEQYDMEIPVGVRRDRRDHSTKPVTDLAGIGFIVLLRRLNCSDDDALAAIRTGVGNNNPFGILYRTVCAYIVSAARKFNSLILAVSISLFRKITMIDQVICAWGSAFLYISFGLKNTLNLSIRTGYIPYSSEKFIPILIVGAEGRRCSLVGVCNQCQAMKVQF